MKQLFTISTILLLSSLSFAIDKDKIQINGYVSFEFEKQIEDEGNGDPKGSFDADLFDIVMNFRVSERLRASADFTWEHGSASEDSRGNLALEYGFLEYSVSDFFKVRFGKLFTPFGTYNEIHTAKPAFLSVKEASSTNKPERIIGEKAFRFFPRWGAGIGIRGDSYIAKKNFDYDLMFANGEQDSENPFEQDQNKFKSISGRFRIDLSDYFQIGTSFHFDKPADSLNQKITLQSHGVEMKVQSGNFEIVSEVLVGFRKANGEKVRQTGFFIEPVYYFENGVTPYFRFEFIDANSKIAKDFGTAYIFGANYEFSQGFMFKLENNFVKGEENTSLKDIPNKSYNEIKAAIVLGF